MGELGGVENRTIRGSVQMTLGTNSGQINWIDTLDPLDTGHTGHTGHTGPTGHTGGTESALPLVRFILHLQNLCGHLG